MPATIPVIRRATAPDAAVVAQLNRHVQDWHATTYPDVFKPKPDPTALTAYFADQINDPDYAVFLADGTGQGIALGYLTCKLLVRPDNPFAYAARRLMIEQVGVAPSVQRRGIGRALFAAAMDHAQGLGCTDVFLDTWTDNHAAHVFFRKLGYAPLRMLFYHEVPSLAP
jgi:ribosomal protein S18 acetylase RimI-like enzyme